ncbi:hypothetical protein QYE76_059769 [Lolium multiflorum]|uniref:Uncharacterized protein n=1 Tax=Lolium multiflorum TaxID=4521 RepID=A0AAD8RYL9_LOLMU|nr:hypothetical protein QYE76_059769 [Lolium multiflorum]
MADGAPVTYEDLTDELKKKYDEVKAILEADLIGSFHRTRSHGIRWKGFSPGALDGVDLSVPSKNAPGPCEIMRHQYSPSGPALGTYQGEVPLQSRPPLSFALAAPEVPNSPAYAVDRVEDMYPGRCQPRYSFNINMVELGHRPDKGRDEGSCSHSEDKEEAAPRDRPRHCQKILVMIKMKADSSDRPVLSVPPALPVCGVDLTVTES